MSKPVQKVVQVASKVVNTVTKTVEAVAHNPLPVIETAALVAVGVPPPVAGAAVAAANGTKKVEDIAKAAVAGYAGAQVGGAVSTGLTGTPIAGSTLSPTIVNIASSAAGASTAATSAALLAGKPLDQALQVGVKAGAASAVGAGVSEATTAVGKEIQAALPAASDTLAQVKQAVQPVTDVVKAAGQAIDPAVQTVKQALPSTTEVKTALAPITQPVGQAVQSVAKAAEPVVQAVAEPVKQAAQTVSEAAQPVIQAAKDIIPAKSDLPQIPTSALKTAQAAGDIVASDITGAAQSGLKTGLQDVLFGQQPTTTSAPSGTPALAATGAPTQTSASPGSQALAQALNVGDPLFDKTGGKPKNVWNQASLRVKDETGT
jgi:hypothetical protein